MTGKKKGKKEANEHGCQILENCKRIAKKRRNHHGELLQLPGAGQFLRSGQGS